MDHLGPFVWPNNFLGWAWAENIRPKADLGQCPLGHLWAWANLGPSWYIGPGRFGLGRARPKPIPNYNQFQCCQNIAFGIINIGKLFFKIEFYHQIENLEATLVSMNEI